MSLYLKWNVVNEDKTNIIFSSENIFYDEAFIFC